MMIDFTNVIQKNKPETRGPLGHVLDAGIRCLGAIKVGIKLSSPVKAHFQGWKLFHKH